MAKFKLSLEFVVGIGFICMWMGVAYESIGETIPAGSYSWYLPFLIAVALGFPFILGILAGRKSKEDQDEK